MPYKNYEKHKINVLRNYYKNREKRIKYQRKWDKENKEKKRLQDQKRYKTKEYNKKQLIRHHSQKVHFPKLMEKFGGCQFCSSKEKLQIHHKKYTKNIKNCLLLCESCHSIVHRKVFKRDLHLL